MPYKDPDVQKEYQREWQAKRRAEFFADKVCVKCGSSVNLELDHIDPKTKVSHNVWSWKLERRLAELAKCQVLCRSCHLLKTVSGFPKARHGGGKLYNRDGCRCSLCRAAKKRANAKRYVSVAE